MTVRSRVNNDMFNKSHQKYELNMDRSNELEKICQEKVKLKLRSNRFTQEKIDNSITLKEADKRKAGQL